MKICTVCHMTKELPEFSKMKRSKDGHMACCKVCDNERGKKYRDSNPDVMWNGELKKRYGITLDDYNSMREEQNGCCAICDTPCATGRRLCVDHNHDTGAVRQLLCLTCNTAIGHARESEELLVRMIDYLRKHT